MSRLSRKEEHLLSAVKLAQGPVYSGFEDIILVHNALPEVSLNDITLKTRAFGKLLEAPLIINAITGGGSIPAQVNEALAVAAREAGVAMAVGSQTVAVERPECERSFKVVRKVNPDGLVFANVGAYVTLDKAKRAVDMIRADALQLHLNVPQELSMREGDISFKGWSDNVARLVEEVGVPVIIKEVGFGLSYEVVKRLTEIGARNFDIGGRGGTNFIAIESLRRGKNMDYLESWGITTAASLIETKSLDRAEMIVATGGIRSPLDIAKSLALGASLAGIAGPFLKILFEDKVTGLIRTIGKTKDELKRIMIMAGVNRPKKLGVIPVVITGKTREWLTERGINTKRFAQRIRN